MVMSDEENIFAIFVAWITSTAGLATCFAYILVTKGFFRKVHLDDGSRNNA